jgi:hypothetical protein
MNALREYSGDASHPSRDDGKLAACRHICAWCREAYWPVRGDVSLFCHVRCRQAAWRLRRRVDAGVGDGSARRFAYADPPYPGKAFIYKGEADFGGEVDHRKLIASLVDQYDGWALSTGAYALAEVLPLCPAGHRVCAWVKPIGANRKTFGIHNCWEPVIVVPGRELQPGKRDWLSAQPARRGGSLMGRKPIQFAAWLFGLLGAIPGVDEFEDLFPGTGIIGRAWRHLSERHVADPSATPRQHASSAAAGDGSASSPGDASASAAGDD